jgi:hypothetical protein
LGKINFATFRAFSLISAQHGKQIQYAKLFEDTVHSDKQTENSRSFFIIIFLGIYTEENGVKYSPVQRMDGGSLKGMFFYLWICGPLNTHFSLFQREEKETMRMER